MMDSAGFMPSSDGWRRFDALDLDPVILTNKLDHKPCHCKWLDLAENRVATELTITGRKINEYVQRTYDAIRPLFPTWADAMPRYSHHAIVEAPSIEMTCEATEVHIQDVISDVRKGVDYNGLNIVNDFIEFYKNQRAIDPKLNSVVIFHRFQPDSRNEASLTHGTTCVGKAWDITQRLKEISVVGHVIVESAGPDEPPVHAAVAVPCKDGVLLVDIEQDVPVVALKPTQPFVKIYPGKGTPDAPEPPDQDNPDLKLSIEIIKTPGNYKTPTPLIVKKENFTTETPVKKNSYAQFVLRPDTNPDQSVMKRWLVSANYYPVSSGMIEGKEQHAIQVNITKKYEKVTFNIGNKKFRIPLDAFDSKKRTIDRSKLVGDVALKLSPEELEKFRDVILGKETDHPVGGSFFKAFKTSKDLLMDQIFNIVEHKQLLQELRER